MAGVEVARAGGYEEADMLDWEDGRRSCLVRFRQDGETCWISDSLIRVLPGDHDRSLFMPSPGDVVEAALLDDNGNLRFWWEGKVIEAKGNFFVIEFPNERYSKKKEVVELDHLRPPQGHPSLCIEKKIIDFPQTLQASNERLQRFLYSKVEKIGEIRGMMASRLDVGNKQLCLIGTLPAVEVALNLVEVVFTQAIHMNLVNKSLKAAELINTEKKYACASFQVDPRYLGLVIGPEGRNLKPAKEIQGIQSIDVYANGLVNIYGNNHNVVEEARKELELITENIPIHGNQVGLIIGKGGSQIIELQNFSSSRMVVKQLEDSEDTYYIQMFGTRHSIDTGKALVKYLISTFQEREEKEALISNLSDELKTLPHRKLRPGRRRQESGSDVEISPNNPRTGDTTQMQEKIVNNGQKDERGHSALKPVESQVTASHKPAATDPVPSQRRRRRDMSATEDSVSSSYSSPFFPEPALQEPGSLSAHRPLVASSASSTPTIHLSDRRSMEQAMLRPVKLEREELLLGLQLFQEGQRKAAMQGYREGQDRREEKERAAEVRGRPGRGRPSRRPRK